MLRRALHFLMLLPLIAGGAAQLCSCVKDDREACLFPLNLQFSYTYNRERRNLLAEEVAGVRLYLFDACCGELCDTISIRMSDLSGGNDTLVWNVTPGQYRVVAWGGNVDASRYQLSSDGTFGGSRLSVPSGNGRAVVQSKDHLWYGAAADIVVDGAADAPVRHIDMRKYSNDVHVVVEGLPAGAFPDLSCTISAGNGEYDFDGVESSDSLVVWLPESRMEGGNAVCDFTVLRLRPGDDSQLHVALSGSNSVIYDGSLSGLLLQNPSLDLDLDDDFLVRLVYRSGPGGGFDVSIYVNGWHVIDMVGPLE